MGVYGLSLLIGVVVGMRSMTGPAAVSWAARMGWIDVDNTVLAFLEAPVTAWIFTVAALGELIADKLPKTPSRKAPMGFIARIVSGGLCGAALAANTVGITGGMLAGIVGAVIGTLGGYEFRRRLVAATGGKDLPIALLEDCIAVVGAFLIVK